MVPSVRPAGFSGSLGALELAMALSKVDAESLGPAMALGACALVSHGFGRGGREVMVVLLRGVLIVSILSGLRSQG
jgi:hypothetical protein